MEEKRKKPRETAQEIIYALRYDPAIISKIEVAGPGFINFFFTTEYVCKSISKILKKEPVLGSQM
ncbi:MAG: hypothetical protein IPG53_01495 [Ignavibacteriales bacterium]|nr:hypothetical protein [Ignavibacteriales bacterium]